MIFLLFKHGLPAWDARVPLHAQYHSSSVCEYNVGVENLLDICSHRYRNMYRALNGNSDHVLHC